MTWKHKLFDDLKMHVQRTGQPPLADLHMHTTWTDGAQSVNAMWQASVDAGLDLILFSEHSRANSVGWFDDFAKQVRSLPDSGCRAMVGTEVKISDLEGNLDLSSDIKAACDLIMASVHRFPNETGVIRGSQGGYTLEQAFQMEFELSMAALDNPDTDILGHPFGMTYRRFGGVPPWELVEALIDKCATTNKAFEINHHYHTEPERMMAACLARDCPMSFGSNAHCVEDVGALQRNQIWKKNI